MERLAARERGVRRSDKTIEKDAKKEEEGLKLDMQMLSAFTRQGSAYKEEED